MSDGPNRARRRNRDVGESDAHTAARDREHDALDQQLPNQTPSCRAAVPRARRSPANDSTRARAAARQR